MKFQIKLKMVAISFEIKSDTFEFFKILSKNGKVRKIITP